MVKKSMEFWKVKRPYVGVSLGETWKCEKCEYKRDCEWRNDQAKMLTLAKSPSISVAEAARMDEE